MFIGAFVFYDTYPNSFQQPVQNSVGEKYNRVVTLCCDRGCSSGLRSLLY